MTALILKDVSVDFPIYHANARSMRRFAIDGALGRKLNLDGSRAVVSALSDINLTVSEGDRLALIGANGAGKSTLLRTMAGVYQPRSGVVIRHGQVTPLLSLGMGLNLDATGRENILLLGMHLDIAPRIMLRKVEEIVHWTELGAFIEAPLKTYSAGMILRLAFAVSTTFPPEILLLDEWFGVADASFQQKAHERMSAFVSGANILVLASHSADLLRSWCVDAVRLDGGRIVERGPVGDLLPQTEPRP